MTLPYYPRYAKNFLEATAGWSLELKGAYGILLDLMYYHGGELPDDPHFIAGNLGCSVRKWKNSARKKSSSKQRYTSPWAIMSQLCQAIAGRSPIGLLPVRPLWQSSTMMMAKSWAASVKRWQNSPYRGSQRRQSWCLTKMKTAATIGKMMRTIRSAIGNMRSAMATPCSAMPIGWAQGENRKSTTKPIFRHRPDERRADWSTSSIAEAAINLKKQRTPQDMILGRSVNSRKINPERPARQNTRPQADRADRDARSTHPD